MQKNIAKKLKTIFIIILMIMAIFYLRSIDAKSHLDTMIVWIEGFGIWTPLIFTLFYILTAGYVLPVILVTIVAGIIFGVLGGSVVVSIAFTLSSVIVYLIGRVYGEKIIPQKIQSSRKFEAVTKALKEDGFKFVFMLRFVPIVSSIILNATCGLIKIKFKDFTLATFLGQLPGTILYTYSGFLAKDILDAQQSMDQRSMTDWVMLVVGIIATLTVVILITLKSKKALQEIE